MNGCCGTFDSQGVRWPLTHLVEQRQTPLNIYSSFHACNTTHAMFLPLKLLLSERKIQTDVQSVSRDFPNLCIWRGTLLFMVATGPQRSVSLTYKAGLKQHTRRSSTVRHTTGKYGLSCCMKQIQSTNKWFVYNANLPCNVVWQF